MSGWVVRTHVDGRFYFVVYDSLQVTQVTNNIDFGDCSGATFGRIVGHIMNVCFPGYVTDSGTYALVGASALLGGTLRTHV